MKYDAGEVDGKLCCLNIKNNELYFGHFIERYLNGKVAIGGILGNRKVGGVLKCYDDMGIF